MTSHFTDDAQWQEQAGGLIGDGFLVEIEAQAVVNP